MHHIQRSILDRLATDSSLRYSQIKPSELDGNVFGYHLKQVIIDGYVKKYEDTGDYTLTPRGKQYIVHRYETSIESAHTIFLCVIRKDDQYLVRRRVVQPLIGKVGFIHGEPAPHHDVRESARIRVLEKTGLDCQFTIWASGLISISDKNDLLSYSHAVILEALTTDDITLSHDETGENYWVNKDDLSVAEFLPSCEDIIELIGSDKKFFELEYRV